MKAQDRIPTLEGLLPGTKITDISSNKCLTAKFNSIDTDNDGILSDEEITIFTNSINVITDKGYKRIYPDMDIKELNGAKIFEDIDVDIDGNGKISQKELDIIKMILSLKDTEQEQKVNIKNQQKKYEESQKDLKIMSYGLGIGLIGGSAAILCPSLTMIAGTVAILGISVCLAVIAKQLLN